MLALAVIVLSLNTSHEPAPQQLLAFTVRTSGAVEDPDAIISDLYVCDLRGKNLRRVAKGITEWLEHGGGSAPQGSGDAFGWSPDAKRLYFHRLQKGVTLAYVVDVYGKAEKRLTPPTYRDMPTKWISNRELAITRSKKDWSEDRIVVIDVDKNKIVKRKYWPDTYSPNRRHKLEYVSRNNWSDVDMIDVRSKRRTTIAKRIEAGFMDVWSPDSKFICSNKGLDDSLVVVNTITYARSILDNKFADNIFWSPNSRYVVWSNDEAQNLYDMTTGKRETLFGAPNRDDVRTHGWTQDSQYLVVTRFDKSPGTIELHPISQGKALHVVTKGARSVRVSGYGRFAIDNGGE